MFEIDLKASASRIEPGSSPAVEAVRALLPTVAVVVVLFFALWFVNGRADASIAARKAQVEKLQKGVDAQRQELLRIGGARSAMVDTTRVEVYWSDELRMLSELLPDKIWVTGLRVETTAAGENQPPRRILRIDGGVLSSSNEANLDLIGDFVGILQRDERFSKSFGKIDLQSITRSGGDTHALLFSLLAPLL